MPSHRHLNPLTNWQKNICEWGGLIGALLSLTCLIQHLAVVIPGKITNPMIPEYLLAIAAFILLGLQKAIAPVLIIISAVYAAIIEYLWMTHASFSLVVMLLFIYHIIILVALYTEQIPQRLIQKRKAEKEEADSWADKI
jgi:hypothetical protein